MRISRPFIASVVSRALLIASCALVSLLLSFLPPSIDFLGLARLADFAGAIFLSFPIELFDTLSSGAFRPQTSGFIQFPSAPQIAFVLLFDVCFCSLLAMISFIPFPPKKGS